MTDHLSYRLTRQRRQTMSLIVHADQSLEVRCPKGVSRTQIDRFVQEKSGWIARKKLESQDMILIGPLSANLVQQQQARLQACVSQALKRFGGPHPQKIRVRDLSSRWGSCSSRQAISINSRCLALPEPLLEYIVYHELCHLVHMSHDRKFWQLLQSFLPDARHRQKLLHQRYRLQSRG